MALSESRPVAVFIDKDGTLVRDLPYNVDPGRIRLSDGAREAVGRLKREGYRLIVVSNQPGVALGRFPAESLAAVEARLRDLLPLDGFYWCPHAREAGCGCRKPAPGLIERAAREHGIDVAGSWMVGDILDDVEAGRRAGCRTVLIDNGNETEWQLGPQRVPDGVAADLEEAARVILDVARH